MDYDSAFNTEVCDTQNTSTHICDVCFNFDVITDPTQIEEASMTYMTKAQAIQNLHYYVGHIAPKRLQHLVENGQWSWTHVSKPVNFARELPPCPYRALAKARRSSFTKPNTIPRRPVPEVHMVGVFNSHVGEVCDEYTCHACDIRDNARRVIIIDSRCSAHMFSDWRVFHIFCPSEVCEWTAGRSLWCG